MHNFDKIEKKLTQFITKYHVHELIRGIILFISIGLFYFLITLLIEGFLWLSPFWRTTLFWLFVIVEVGLCIFYLVFPLSRLFKLTKGLDHTTASKLIGRHFPEVKDKLTNILQLRNHSKSSDLLLASIEQKSLELKTVPFKLAINFKENLQYFKYTALPIAILLTLFLFNKISWISDGYNRVVNYQKEFIPPAPFVFEIQNDSLVAIENKNFRLQVITKGAVQPEQVLVQFANQSYYLSKTADGVFEYRFENPQENLPFRLTANGVDSKTQLLEVVAVPTFMDIAIDVFYPKHTKRATEHLRPTEKITVPEGTKVQWQLQTRNTNTVHFVSTDTLITLKSSKPNSYTFTKQLFRDYQYTIASSNAKIKNHDQLSYEIKVIKDAYPEIHLTAKEDSLDSQKLYFFGRISDDYGLKKLELKYYQTDQPQQIYSQNIQIKSTIYEEFYHSFPDTLALLPGRGYAFYFEVSDNDALHGFKKSKSKLFFYNKLDQNQQDRLQLENQKNTLSDFSKSLERFDQQQQELSDIHRLQLEKNKLSFSDNKKVENLLKRQQQEKKALQDFAKQLKRNLDKIPTEKEPFKDALKERFARNQERLQKNQKLLEELKKIHDKIGKQELLKKLDKLSKENKTSKRNLEQLLELTKKFYVEQKFQKLASTLRALAEKQKELSKAPKEENTKAKQKALNKQFENFTKELDTLKKENQKLKKPLQLDRDVNTEQEIQKKQQESTEQLAKNQNQKAQQNQKSAAQKMKQLSQSMQSQMQASGEQQQMEDMEMLRQILDNLVTFSLREEDLMQDFRTIHPNSPSYSSLLRRQNNFRENFIHIDDSLYALALRTPKIEEKVTDKLVDIAGALDKSLKQLAENNLIPGMTSIQYTIKDANALAYLLSQALESMQNSMASMGNGKGKSNSNEFQLPDIIKEQESLNKQTKDLLKKKGKGNSKGQQEGQQKKDQGSEKKQPGSSKDKGDKKGKKQEQEQGQEQGQGQGQQQESNDQLSEEQYLQIYEIYKRQQQLRSKLEDKIKKAGIQSLKSSQVLDKMKQAEQELLHKNLGENTLRRMEQIQHELLKMDRASLEQGKKKQRSSKSNQQEFSRQATTPLSLQKLYFNTTEILNRKSLPLQHFYKKKTQEYFKNHD